MADLSNLSLPSKKKQREIATGTDDVTPNDLTYTGRIGVRQRISANSNEQTNLDNDSKTAFSNAPGRTRTCNLRIRSPRLYPIELRAPKILSFCNITSCYALCQFLKHSIQAKGAICVKFVSIIFRFSQNTIQYFVGRNHIFRPYSQVVLSCCRDV